MHDLSPLPSDTASEPAQAADNTEVEAETPKPNPQSAPTRNPAYPPPSDEPTQQGPFGIKFDFNLGARILTPAGQWRVRLLDVDTGNILFERENAGAFVTSSKRFFVRFGIEVWAGDKMVMSHSFDSEWTACEEWSACIVS